MPCIGLLTDYGSDKVIEAMDNAGFFIKPTRFGVTSVAGAWRTDRLPDDNPPCWYTAVISGAHKVAHGTIEFTCTIPPNAHLEKMDIREIQIFAEDGEGVEFFLGFGQPGDPPLEPIALRYSPEDMIEIRLQIIISPLSVDQTFNFIYSQAQEIDEHNLNPDSHPFILELLKRYGITVNEGTNNYYGTWIDPFPVFDSETIHNGDWVYLTENGTYSLAIADGTFKEYAPGMLRISENGDDTSVVYGGLVSVAYLPLTQGATLYLSDAIAGRVTGTPTARALGVCLGGTTYLTASGGSSFFNDGNGGGGGGGGGGSGGGGTLTFCGVDSANDTIVVWSASAPDTVVALYSIAETFEKLMEPMEAGQYGLCERTDQTVSLYKSTGAGAWGEERVVNMPEIFNFATFKTTYFNDSIVTGAVYWFFGNFVLLEFSMELATAEAPGIVQVDGKTTYMEDSYIKVPIAKNNVLGLVQPDGVTSIVTNLEGRLETPVAANNKLGLVKPDGSTCYVSGGYLSARGSGSAAFPGDSPTILTAWTTGKQVWAINRSGWFCLRPTQNNNSGDDCHIELFPSTKPPTSNEAFPSQNAILATTGEAYGHLCAAFLPVSAGQYIRAICTNGTPSHWTPLLLPSVG